MIRNFSMLIVSFTILLFALHTESRAFDFNPCPPGENTCSRIMNSTDVSWLKQQIISPEFADQKYWIDAGKCRQLAYVRLALLGTEESLTAIDRLEADVRVERSNKANMSKESSGPIIDIYDLDGDGIPDAEEKQYGLDILLKDTDGDGLDDAIDSCPNYNGLLNAEKDSDEDAQILQKAVYFIVGFKDDDGIFISENPSRKLQIWGYKGRIIYCESPQGACNKYNGEHRFLHWDSVVHDKDLATVEVSAVYGPKAGSGWIVIFQKISKKWYVVGWMLHWIS